MPLIAPTLLQGRCINVGQMVAMAAVLYMVTSLTEDWLKVIFMFLKHEYALTEYCNVIFFPENSQSPKKKK